MRIRKNTKGITLISLVITIIILIILASVATYSGIQVVNSSKLAAFTTELKIMQTQVNELYDKDSRNEINVNTIGKDISTVQTQANKVFSSNESGITDQTGYRYYDKETIENLGIEGVEGEFFVKVSERSVVSYDGLKYDGKTYYTLKQLPDSLYNVQYNNDTISNKPTFSVKVEWLKEGEYRLSANNINYDGNINNWNLEYKLENETDFKESKDLKVNIYEQGTYKVKIANGIFKSDEVTAIVEEPKVGDIVHYETILSKTENIVNSTRLAQLKSDLQTYSGDDESTDNAEIDRDSLTWKVLDIKNGKIRLISAVPTTKKIKLYGFDGYNNIVYLIDKTCDVLYSVNAVGKAQNLKIEDIQDHLTYDYTQYVNTNVTPNIAYNGIAEYTNRYYPNIYSKEVGCKAISDDNNTGNTLGLSQQESPIKGKSLATNRLKITQTVWQKTMSGSDFTDSKYLKIFIKNDSNQNLPYYFLSSRAVNCSTYSCYFVAYRVYQGNVNMFAFCNSISNGEQNGGIYSFRPVVSLEHSVKLSGNSTDGWIIE